MRHGSHPRQNMLAERNLRRQVLKFADRAYPEAQSSVSELRLKAGDLTPSGETKSCSSVPFGPSLIGFALALRALVQRRRS